MDAMAALAVVAMPRAAVQRLQIESWNLLPVIQIVKIVKIMSLTNLKKKQNEIFAHQ